MKNGSKNFLIKRDIVFSIVFSFIGVSILIISIVQMFKSEKDYEKALNIDVRYKELVSPLTIKVLKGSIKTESRFWVFFLLNPNTCSPCFNEVEEYQQILKDKGVETMLMFLDENYEKVNRFVKFIDIKMNICYVEVNTIRKLFRQNDLNREIIFYDIKSEKIFYRRILFNGEVTSFDTKVYLIERIFNYWAADN